MNILYRQWERDFIEYKFCKNKSAYLTHISLFWSYLFLFGYIFENIHSNVYWMFIKQSYYSWHEGRLKNKIVSIFMLYWEASKKKKKMNIIQINVNKHQNYKKEYVQNTVLWEKSHKLNLEIWYEIDKLFLCQEYFRQKDKWMQSKVKLTEIQIIWLGTIFIYMRLLWEYVTADQN